MHKTFIISLIETGSGLHQQSAQKMLPRTLSLCEKHGWSVEVFPAINGYNLQDSDWEKYGVPVPPKSDKFKKKFGNLLGAQGCFLSHFTLWNKCVSLNEPIIVLEDDADVLGPPPTINTTLDIVKFHNPTKPLRKPGIHGKAAPGAYAYWISPVGAKKLIKFTQLHGGDHVDKVMGSFVVNWDYLQPRIVKLGPRVGSSTNPISYPYPDDSLRCY